MVKPETPMAQVLHQFNYCPCQYLEQNWIVPKQPWLLNLDGWRDNPNFNLWCLEEWRLRLFQKRLLTSHTIAWLCFLLMRSVR